MAIVYGFQRNLNVTVFRTSNVYGPHSQKNFEGYNLVNHFIDLAKAEKMITIFGSGSQQRDYIYINDLMDAFALAITNIKSKGQIYNLGSGQGISLKHMAQTIINYIGKGKIKYISWPKKYKEVETGSYITNLKKINKELGFSPKVRFTDGIKMTINTL